jgi:1,4-dihydroxy-2-naphthoate octaprenyltransferase
MLPYLLHCVIDNTTAMDGSSSSSPLLRDPSTLQIIIYGIQIGLLGTNIIIVNNLRDCETDVLANKRTTTVRFGTLFSKVQYSCNYVLSYTLVLIPTIMMSQSNPRRNAYYYSSLQLLPLLTIVPAVREVRAILHKRGADLNPHVGGAAKVQFLFCLLVAMQLLLLP